MKHETENATNQITRRTLHASRFTLHEKGFTLIEVIIAMGLIVMLFGGIFLVYYSVLDVSTNTEVRAAASLVLNREIEVIRNLPYDKVGTLGGVPAGVLSQVKTVSSTVGNPFVVATVVRNIDDPFDGTLGGTPNDTAPADYKLVEVEVSCPTCARFRPILLTTHVAPKNLESSSANGSLFVNVIDASGGRLGDAVVRVVNASTSPTIDLTDTTNASGVLQLVGMPTSTLNYQITVTRTGYTTDKNYRQGAADNPNPLTPYSTVAAQALTQTTFQIDRVSSLTLNVKDILCSALGVETFSVTSTKLIGTNPNIMKFSTTTATNASGTASLANMEWDTYGVLYAGAKDIVGTIPLVPVALAPSSTASVSFILQTANARSLLVTAETADGAPIPSATVQLSKSGYSNTLITGRGTASDSDWSAGNYVNASGMDADTTPGSLTMALVGGHYSTSTTEWLVSNTIDLGSASGALYRLGWAGNAPAGTTARIQVAVNTDNATWSFVGPDGTGNTYFTAVTSTLLGAQYSNIRYVRYKIFFTTTNGNSTPQVDDVSFQFNGLCVPQGQALFTGLAVGTYTLDVSAAGYSAVSSSVTISGSRQATTVLLAP